MNAKLAPCLGLVLTPALLCAQTQVSQQPTASNPTAIALMAFERDVEVAAARRDSAYLGRAIADDFAGEVKDPRRLHAAQ